MCFGVCCQYCTLAICCWFMTVQKPGRWCAAHVRIAWEIHLGRLQQQQQQKQHGSSGAVEKDERRATTSSGSESRYGDRPSENGRCKALGDALHAFLCLLIFHNCIAVFSVTSKPCRFHYCQCIRMVFLKVVFII